MIINLKKSELFTVHPDKRFSRKYEVKAGTWTDLWKRYKLLGYTFLEMRDLYRAKTGKDTDARTMKRWVFRTEVYSKANPLIEKGAESVVSSFFGEFEWALIEELTKNIKSSGNTNLKALP